jgi:23S rRNA pseudouridine2457 synthase
MVSQFVSSHEVNLLKHLDFDFPVGTHAVGRLDSQTEGLLILTTNKRVTSLLFEGSLPHKRTYWVQAAQHIPEERIEQLRNGVAIRIKNGIYYKTKACEAQRIEKPSELFRRADEFRADLPQTWLAITLTEGKYHQIRKMMTAIYFPCLRLIRVAIEDLHLEDLQPGQVKELEEVRFFQLLKIIPPTS